MQMHKTPSWNVRRWWPGCSPDSPQTLPSGIQGCRHNCKTYLTREGWTDQEPIWGCSECILDVSANSFDPFFVVWSAQPIEILSHVDIHLLERFQSARLKKRYFSIYSWLKFSWLTYLKKAFCAAISLPSIFNPLLVLCQSLYRVDRLFHPLKKSEKNDPPPGMITHLDHLDHLDTHLDTVRKAARLAV